jgi:predicted phage terminase large subunit-like protein
VEEFFLINATWSPDMFFVEDGQIWKAIRPMLEKEMQLRDIWLSVTAILPVKDKAVRGRPLQKRMKSGGVRVDKDADWYAGFEEELLRFTGNSEALLDDQFDSAAILARGCETTRVVEDEDALTEDEMEFLARSRELQKQTGRSAVTGY